MPWAMGDLAPKAADGSAIARFAQGPPVAPAHCFMMFLIASQLVYPPENTTLYVQFCLAVFIRIYHLGVEI